MDYFFACFCWLQGIQDHKVSLGDDHEMKMRRKCRLWWPKQLSSSRESSSSLLLGWFVTASPVSLDIIVAFTCSEVLISRSDPSLEVWNHFFFGLVQNHIWVHVLLHKLLSQNEWINNRYNKTISLCFIYLLFQYDWK